MTAHRDLLYIWAFLHITQYVFISSVFEASYPSSLLRCRFHYFDTYLQKSAVPFSLLILSFHLSHYYMLISLILSSKELIKSFQKQGFMHLFIHSIFNSCGKEVNCCILGIKKKCQTRFMWGDYWSTEKVHVLRYTEQNFIAET